MSAAESSGGRASVPHAGLLSTLRTVIFGLLGVAHNRADLDERRVRISPVRLILIGVIFMVCLVTGLVTLATHIASG